jgi:hypothetical protein
MPVTVKLSGDRSPGLLKNVAVRTGIYAGLALAFIFTAWMLIANRGFFPARFAMDLNIATAALIIFFASLPLMRFYPSPAKLLASGLLAWGVLALTYRVLGFVSGLFEENYSASQVFALGAVIYLIFATLSWIGTIIWRVRARHASHTHY